MACSELCVGSTLGRDGFFWPFVASESNVEARVTRGKLRCGYLRVWAFLAKCFSPSKRTFLGAPGAPLLNELFGAMDAELGTSLLCADSMWIFGAVLVACGGEPRHCDLASQLGKEVCFLNGMNSPGSRIGPQPGVLIDDKFRRTLGSFGLFCLFVCGKGACNCGLRRERRAAAEAMLSHKTSCEPFTHMFSAAGFQLLSADVVGSWGYR